MKNLLLLPSSLTLYLLLIPIFSDLALKIEDKRKVEPKDLIALVSLTFTAIVQQTLRYQEDTDKNLYTPKGLPGQDKLNQDDPPNTVNL
jgi:hypothetical protein